ncbi:ThiF family protein [Chitinophaga sp. YR573]|uniref:ThiF family adenylyltransferase n=1 Tax=Chitinophaga sp. YR573 TaxID=1881040 RepID=UPI0008CAECF1|nr:ThiF family adenylyltransferase [Chitinophaga sp. YR573]SEW21783.1 ThiF family protein [Chitinophaga sp. YR573]
MTNENNVLTESEKMITPAIYGRSKGAFWFDAIYKRDIVIIGQGGIGSWLSLLLSRTGVRLHVYDKDIFEDHNGGQVMFDTNVGQKKVEAIKNTISSFSPDCEIETHGEYTRTSETSKIVLCGPDKIEVRRLAFEKWAAYVNRTPEHERSEFFFQDGRLLAEQMWIYNVPGDRPDLMEKYYNNCLEKPDESDTPSCTYTQTTPTAAGIAAHMIFYITNWLSNVKKGKIIRNVPFSYEFLIPLDKYDIEY